MEVAVSGASGYYVYGSIKADTLRNYVDDLFPSLAKNLDADYISGAYHRYKGGHDLLLDVPKTLMEKGFVDALKHAGHILLTDFPTKAGIPIPGLSHTGLGKILEDYGIAKGWLNINIMDGGIGFIAIDEGHTDLLSSISENINLDTFQFFDTYTEGGVELLLAVNFQNPFLFIGAIENITAGLIATIKKHSIYINPLDFFGAGITSAIIGGSLSYFIAKGEVKYIEILKSSLKSSSIGSLFKVFTPFGFGLLGGYIVHEVGKYMAQDTTLKINDTLYISHKEFEKMLNLLQEEGSKQEEYFLSFWKNMNNIKIISMDQDIYVKENKNIYLKENKNIYLKENKNI